MDKRMLCSENGIGKRALAAVLQTLAAFVVLAVIWSVAHLLVGNELLLPAFWDCLQRAAAFLTDGGFWTAFFATLLRVLMVFVVSFIFAAIFAFISYMVAWFERFFAPFIAFLRATPVLAALLVILVWVGVGVAPVVVAFLSLFPMLYTGVLAALRGVDSGIEEMNRVYNVPLKKQILQFYLPTIAPYVIREGSGGLAFSLKLVVSAEVLANTYQSLGGLMQEAKLYYEMPALFALVLLVCLFGFLLETLGMVIANALERRAR